jgi:hypothetical protein
MNRLFKYFVVSIVFNVAVLVFLFMPEKNQGPVPVSGGKQRKGVSLIPASLLPTDSNKDVNTSSKNHRYRLAEVSKKSSEGKKENQEKKPDSNKHLEEKNVVEIPDHNREEKKLMNHEEYKSYKKSLALEGSIVTEMHVNFPERVSDSSMKEIITFFGFKIVAYPSQNPNYLLVCNAPEFEFKRLDTGNQLKEFYNNNSNRTIEPEKGLLRWVQSELSRQGMSSNDLKISIVLGVSSGYFHWKEILAAKNVSKPINDVNYTEASIEKTPQGYWLLLVDGIYLKNGQYLKVDDQELKEILL